MNTSSVIPAIIPQSLAHLHQSIQTVAGVVETIQIDITDGAFVPSASWPYATRPGELAAFIEDGGLSNSAPCSFELDLMVRRPEDTLEQWLALGAARLVFHIESTTCIAELIARTRAAGKEIGLAVSNGTSYAAIASHVRQVDVVQCMGIAEIGQQGKPFDERVLQRIRMIKEDYPDMLISVDGGVNKDTIVPLHEVGATRFVSGSAIFDAPDPQRAYRDLVALVSDA